MSPKRWLLEHPRVEREPSSAAGPMESSQDDPMRPALRAELCMERQLRHDGEAKLAHKLDVVEARLAALEEFRKTHEWTVWQTSLEAGRQSPAVSFRPGRCPSCGVLISVRVVMERTHEPTTWPPHTAEGSSSVGRPGLTSS